MYQKYSENHFDSSKVILKKYTKYNDHGYSFWLIAKIVSFDFLSLRYQQYHQHRDTYTRESDTSGYASTHPKSIRRQSILFTYRLECGTRPTLNYCRFSTALRADRSKFNYCSGLFFISVQNPLPNPVIKRYSKSSIVIEYFVDGELFTVLTRLNDVTNILLRRVFVNIAKI